jgi:hypothetical protein
MSPARLGFDAKKDDGRSYAVIRSIRLGERISSEALSGETNYTN